MSRRSAGSTAALLQRASSQLKGERVVQASDEDDLQAYINSLTKRTAPKKSLSFEEDSEISISNEDFQYGGADIPVTASRFLKKKGDVADSLDSVESIGPRDSLQRKFLKKKVPGPADPGTSPIPANRPSTARGSSRNSVASGGFSRPGQSYNQKPSVLNKAEALATKISQRPAPTRQANFSLDTDSEESPRKPAAAARPVHSRSPSPMRSATDSSMSLGRDGGKFVKRKSDPPPPPDFLTSQNAAKSEQKSKPKPSPRNSLTSAKGGRKLVGNLMLSSEEESLAEFIEGLSGSEVSLQRSSSPGKRGGGGVPVRSSPSPEQKPLGRAPSPSHHPKHSPFKRTSSPASNSGLHARSMSDESLHSDTMYTKADTVSMEEEDQFNVNVVMDLDTLGPVMSLDLDNQSPLLSPKKPASVTPSPSPFFKSQSGTPTKQKKTPAAKSDIYSIKKSSKKESKSKGVKPESELLSNFGLHTVDELMGLESKGSKDSSKDMSVVSDISEILTDKPSNMFKASRPVQDSIAEGISEVETRADVKEQYSYSEQFDSISEKIGEDSSLGQTASEVETQYSDEDSKKNDKKDYTDDFASASETDVESYSDSYTSNTDSRTYSYTRSSFSVSQSKNAVGKKSVEVQTGDQPGLTYQWNTHHSGMAFMGPSFGLSYTDPTPIATHTVSPEALEALTTYSPAMLALHDMLKQQLELTQTFIQAQHYLYSSYTRSIEPEHKYTTLEDTKQYIKKHRKPRLTFKEALKLVDREMK